MNTENQFTASDVYYNFFYEWSSFLGIGQLDGHIETIGNHFSRRLLLSVCDSFIWHHCGVGFCALGTT